MSITNILSEHKELDAVGGPGYLGTLAAAVPSAAHIVHYGEIVAKKAALRRLIAAASEINEMGYDEAEDIDTIVDRAEQKIFAVAEHTIKKDFVSMGSLVETAKERIANLHANQGDLRGVPTGFSNIDNLLAGLQRSDLIILAARPSVGKTSFALDIARKAATHHNVPVGIFSLEMSADQLVDRMIAAEANIDLWRLRMGRDLRNDDMDRMGDAMKTLSDAPIYIDDIAVSGIMDMRTLARRVVAEHHLGLIIIDYLQLMEGRSRDNRVQEIAEISRGLKGLAKELNIPILALSQLSRAVESRRDRPRLSDLRESGSIEQDADVVIFLHREDGAREKAVADHNGNLNIPIDVIVAKHRNGPVGNRALNFREKSASFTMPDHEHDFSLSVRDDA